MAKPLSEIFKSGESPYFGMYIAGKAGYPLQEVMAYLRSLGIPVREKDVQNWENGNFNHSIRDSLDPMIGDHSKTYELTGKTFEQVKLLDFPKLPDGWRGTSRRFFPCNEQNRPMRKWGWDQGHTPSLYDCVSAKAMSPCGWVGQNMLYQTFIVMDIDGVGHGERDDYVIAFGDLFKDKTLCMEDPAKPGSFHLYFSTDRLIPVKHFPWAKLDLMGNAVNAAVYLKNKVSNGVSMAPLTEKIWDQLISYQSYRKGMML